MRVRETLLLRSTSLALPLPPRHGVFKSGKWAGARVASKSKCYEAACLAGEVVERLSFLQRRCCHSGLRTGTSHSAPKYSKVKKI